MLETALVTGATGFVGRHLVEALRARGTHVRALVRSADHGLPADVEIVHGDLTVADGAIERAAFGATHVFHCAGVVGDRVEWDRARKVNVGGTERVARAACEAGVAVFVHVSSVAVYGFDAGVFSETAEIHTVGEPYIDTKSEGERVCAAELAKGRTRLRIVRPSIIYGSGDTGMLPRLAEILRQRVPMIGDGGAPVGLVHIDDVIAALLAAAEYSGDFVAFNVAGTDDVTWRELIEALSSRLGLPTPRSMPAPVAMFAGRVLSALAAMHLAPNPPPMSPFMVKFLTAVRRYPIDRMRAELGVTPRVSVHHGLAVALDETFRVASNHAVLAPL